MINPVQAYYASAPTPQDEYLDEEQMAQRYGHISSGEPAFIHRVRRRVGKTLIHIGEKLAADNASIRWSNEAI